MDTVTIFDTTLRDGEQSPGCSMNLAEKLEVARALAALRVDVIEAGFPVASPGDFACVEAIAKQIQGPTICGLARCAKADIEAVAKATAPAAKRRIHVFLATSPIHREHKLRMTAQEVVARAVEGISVARALCDDVEFSAEDAARTEPEFLVEVFDRAIEAGATTLNLPDTVGYSLPETYGGLVHYLKKHMQHVARAKLSVHCHNDLGLAVANTLAALEAGARQVECTINGLGERAGNCSLEEVVMALRTRADHYALTTNIDTQKLYPTSRIVATATGQVVPRNKAIVGDNAFAHESGIHQHGVMAHAGTYEIMRPEDVGVSRNQLVLGKHSGRHALRQRVEEMGYTLDDVRLQKVFDAFKELADKKKEIYDGDIAALMHAHVAGESVGQALPVAVAQWRILAVNINGGKGALPSAVVQMERVMGRAEAAEQRLEAATGTGPIDAAFNAIARVCQVGVRLRDYQVHSVTVGTDSQGDAQVELECAGKFYRGRASSIDIIEASATAFMHAINRVLAEQPPALARAANA